jgi:hypothetical protein
VKYIIKINDQRFEVELSRLSGAQVRALSGITPDHSLIVERQGDAPDQLLGDEDTISLENGNVSIFSKPPTAFGFEIG